MNPLDRVGEAFAIDLMNPNPSSGRNKAGPWYRVSFEIGEVAYGQFQRARELAGMVLEAQVIVTALNEPNTRARTAASGPASEEGVKEPGEGEVESRTGRDKTLAETLHIGGYFRSARLWLAMHDSGIYTSQEHFDWLATQPCRFGKERSAMAFGRPCAGDVVTHHCNAANTVDGGKRQPEAPQKPLHYWGEPLCHAHHTWAHSSTGADRADKERLLEHAVAMTAGQMKAKAKEFLGIESLREITLEMLKTFEEAIGL